MAVIFGSVMSHGRHMLFGARPDGEVARKSPLNVSVPLIGGLVGAARSGCSRGRSTRSCARPRWWS